MDIEAPVYAAPGKPTGAIVAENALESYFSAFRGNIIGQGQTFVSPFGKKEIVYADWTASGRAYQPIEDRIQKEIMPFVANTHSGTTITATLMTRAYHQAKVIIKQHVNADSGDIMIFCGSGMTGAVNKLQRILGLRIPERMIDYAEKNNPGLKIDECLRPVVFVTHMEHHSNQVSWLETIATVVIIDPDENGNVCLRHFRGLLDQYKHRKNKIAAVTACSNVTGIETPVHEIARLVHEYGGLCFVDFATSAPYIHIDMHPIEKGTHLDAIYFSPHKFLGGPGSPGVLIFNRTICKNTVPDQPGGGTVTYTNPWNTRVYIADTEEREDGGTPPFLQGIKAAMSVRLKEAMGVENIRQREEEMLKIIFERLSKIKDIAILESGVKERLGVISFIVKGAHHNLIVKILNDRFGIQARGGCSCAGTYGHKLLHVDKSRSYEILNLMQAGNLFCKPGWVRLSVHPTMSNGEIDFIMDSVESAAFHFEEWVKDYTYNNETNEYCFNGGEENEPARVEGWFNISENI